MPGIVGLVQSGSSETRRLTVEQMLAGMKHEPGNAAGLYCRPDIGVCAGWVARDDSSAVYYRDPERNIALIVHGELAHEPAVGRQDLLKELIDAYARQGAGFLNGMNGWFCGVLLDVRQGRAFLFNDRFGLGRVYVAQDTDGFFFASEAKALLQVLPQTRRLDERGVAEWLSCGCVLQNRTLFSGIQLLPPGSVWTLSADGVVGKARYFDPATWQTQPALSAAEYYEQLKETFPRILSRYLKDSQPLAMSLTGGLDGRMIMAWARREPGQLPCYTFNGPVRDCADVRLARRVARACGQSHQTIPIDDRFFQEFPALAEKAVYVSDGAMDVTGAAELYVNRFARGITPVRLTGNYGSEILRSHLAFRAQPLTGGVYSGECIQQAQLAQRTYAEEARGSRLAFIAFKQVPWHHFARFSVEQSQLSVRSPFLDNDLVALAFRAPTSPDAGLELSLRLIADGNAQLARIPTDRGLTYPARGIGNRFKRSFHEFLAKAEYAYDYGMPDWLARADRCLAPLHLERLFLGRQKFCHFRSWYRDRLTGFVRDILLDSRSLNRPYLQRQGVERIVSEHTSGRRNHTLSLHKLLSAEFIHRSLFERA